MASSFLFINEGVWLVVLVVSCFLARHRSQPEDNQKKEGHIWVRDSKQ